MRHQTGNQTVAVFRFMSTRETDGLLMAEYDGGRKWWVVGFVKYPEKINLPKWEG